MLSTSKFYIKVLVAFWKDFFLYRAREVHLISFSFIKLLSFPTTIYWPSPVYVFDTFEILRELQMSGFISGTSLCHWFSSLFSCQHRDVIDVIALELGYLQHHASCLALHYYLGILCFPLNFRIYFYTYMKSIIRILFWIALITRHWSLGMINIMAFSH